MNRRKLYLVMTVILASLMLVAVGVVLAADVQIDDFSTAAMDVSHTISKTIHTYPLTVSQHGAASGQLGGYRDLCLQIVDGNNDSIGRAFVSTGSNNYVVQDLGNTVRARTTIQWDGNDGACTLDPVGLQDAGNGEDLTDGDTNEGILLRIIASDGLPVTFRVRIYTDASNWAERTIPFESFVASGSVVDLFLPFTSFTDDGAGTMDPKDVGAVEIVIDASASDSAGADMTIDLVKATSVYDYGDVPLIGSAGLPVGQTGFHTNTVNARHIPAGMRLGANVDAEPAHSATTPNPRASVNADGDDNLGTPDDEDGVTRREPQNWETVAEGRVWITTRGCSVEKPCFVSGWIDWNQDGVFDAANNERILHRVEYTANGTQSTPYFTIPSGTSFTDVRYYARFRICSIETSTGACNTPTLTNAIDGEVEDYAWDWGNVPLAVTLAAFEAQPQANAVLVTWETAAELDNLGFNLYRSDSAAGPWTQLNAELIPAQNPGAVFGAVYEWLDADAAPGALAYYRLEDVDIHGVSAFHGPVSAAPLSPSAVRLSNFSAGGPFIGLALALGSLALFTGLKKRR